MDLRYLVVALFVCIAIETKAADLTLEACRDKNATIDILADCVEREIYDPCTDATGKWSFTRCSVVHKRVAERRIDRATREIAERCKASGIVMRGSFNERGEKQPPRDYTVEANRIWRDYVWEHCLLLNALYGAGFESGEQGGFCEERMFRERADMLEQILKGMVERGN